MVINDLVQFDSGERSFEGIVVGVQDNWAVPYASWAWVELDATRYCAIASNPVIVRVDYEACRIVGHSKPDVN